MELPIEDLTPQSFAPFGKVIEKPERAHDAAGPGWQWWGENALLASEGRPYQIGYLDLKPSEPSFDWAERHMHTAELIVPTGGDCLVYVGPPDHPDDPGRLPSLDRFHVFHVRQNQAVLLDKGVWHGAPLTLDIPLNAVVLLLQGAGEDDLSLVRFEENPVRIAR
jgi:ureidoglycolate lyase